MLRALLWLALMCLLARPAFADVADRQAALRQGVVLVFSQVSGGLGQGTAFVVAQAGPVSWLITCQHVVSNGGTPGAWLEGSQELVPLEIVAQDPNADLALLRARDLRATPLRLAAPGSIRVGRSLGVIGYPRVDFFVSGGLGVTASISQGIVSAVRDRVGISLIQTDASINPGNSGGPALDWETCQVVGVASATLREAQNINLLVAVDEVHGLLKANGIRIAEPPRPRGLGVQRPRPRPSPVPSERRARPIPPLFVMLGLIGVLVGLGMGLWAVLRGGSSEPPDPGPSL